MSDFRPFTDPWRCVWVEDEAQPATPFRGRWPAASFVRADSAPGRLWVWDAAVPVEPGQVVDVTFSPRKEPRK